VANVHEARIELGDVKEMHFTEEEMARYRLLPGDVLLNEGQSPEFLGRPAMWTAQTDEMYFTNSLIRFRAGEAVLPEWALLVFRRHMHFGRFAQESRITTNIAHLALGRFKTVEFPVPPLAEQRRIIAELERRLSHLDAAIEALRTAMRRVETLRAAVMQAACTGGFGLPVQDEPTMAAALSMEREELRATARPRRIEVTHPVGTVPRGWVMVPLIDLAWDWGYGTSVKCGLSSDGPVVVRIPNIKRGQIVLDAAHAGSWRSSLRADKRKPGSHRAPRRSTRVS
jgi:type I restriction enzyme S subunit